MKVLDKVAVKNEQHTVEFQTDIKNSHGYSIANLGTSIFRYKLSNDVGEISIMPGEEITFSPVANAPFEDDSLTGRFEGDPNVLPADRVDVVRIIKYVGMYRDC